MSDAVEITRAARQALSREAVEAFLFQEAWLADSHSYDEWLALWDRDAAYWLPCNDDDADPASHVAIIYDRYIDLEDRIARLKSEHAHIQQPRSRLSRIIGNVRLGEAEGGLVKVHSTLNITAFRRGQFDIFAGRVVHRLRSRDDGFRLVSKTVYLVNNDGVIENLNFIV